MRVPKGDQQGEARRERKGQHEHLSVKQNKK